MYRIWKKITSYVSLENKTQRFPLDVKVIKYVFLAHKRKQRSTKKTFFKTKKELDWKIAVRWTFGFIVFYLFLFFDLLSPGGFFFYFATHRHSFSLSFFQFEKGNRLCVNMPTWCYWDLIDCGPFNTLWTEMNFSHSKKIHECKFLVRRPI